MASPLAPALLRISDTDPKTLRRHAGLSQSDFASFFGVSTSTVQRSERSASFDNWPTGGWLWLAAWVATFGPDTIQAMQAAGRWALVPDVRNAADALVLVAQGEEDAIEASIQAALRGAR